MFQLEESLFAVAGFEPQVLFSTSSNVSKYRMVLAEVGCALLPGFFAKPDRGSVTSVWKETGLGGHHVLPQGSLLKPGGAVFSGTMPGLLEKPEADPACRNLILVIQKT